MKTPLWVLCLAFIALACSKPDNTETTADTTAAEVLGDADSQPDTAQHEPRGDMDDHSSMMSEYQIGDESGRYASDPFGFSLDTTTLKDLLGKGVTVQAIETEAGQDDDGPYDAYTYFIVTSPNAELKFYSYPGKHHADIRTPALVLRNGVKVGMTRQEFLAAMSFDIAGNQEAEVADAYVINNEYGSVYFYFLGDTLESVSVDYEEGD